MTNMSVDSAYNSDIKNHFGNFRINISSTYTATYYDLKRMRDFSNFTLIADTGYLGTHAEAGRSTWSFRRDVFDNSGNAGLMLRHANTANVLFVDGHCESLSAKELRQSPMQIKPFVTGNLGSLTLP